jgi:pimeloyl-ACP methyl ester carboxylesterase
MCGLFVATATLLLLPPLASQGYVTLPADYLTAVARSRELMTQARTTRAYQASREVRDVDIGGYHLHLVCAGHGRPTVVLEAGWPGGDASWAYVAPTIALQTRVCVYDRAGTGKSGVGPSPRTPLHMVGELHLLLTRAHLPGPYVLVGHSFGGLLVRLFAATYPHDVAGLVLVDSSVFDLTGHCPFPTRFPPGVERVEGCTADVQRIGFRPGMLGHKPLAILLAGADPSIIAAILRPTDAVQTEQAWLWWQRHFTALSTRHLLVVVPQSNHMIQLTQPAYVSAAVVWTFEAARAKRGVRG